MVTRDELADSLASLISRWYESNLDPEVFAKHVQEELRILAREAGRMTLVEAAKATDWTTATWKPQEAETVVKMRRGLLARADRIGSDSDV